MFKEKKKKKNQNREDILKKNGIYRTIFE